MVDAGNHGADEIRPEALFVQAARDQVGHGLGRDLAFLAQAVHVNFVAEEIRHGRYVRGEARQPQVYVAVAEDFGEVVGYGQGLHPEAEVARDGHAVFTDHSYAGTAVLEGIWLAGGRGRTEMACMAYLC